MRIRNNSAQGFIAQWESQVLSKLINLKNNKHSTNTTLTVQAHTVKSLEQKEYENFNLLHVTCIGPEILPVTEPKGQPTGRGKSPGSSGLLLT